MDIKILQGAVKAISGTGIQEFCLETKNNKVRIIKEPESSSALPDQIPAERAPEAASPAVQQPSLTAGGKTEMKKASAGEVLSSTVGFFRRGHKKADTEIVKLRDMVKKGQTIAIVEAMHIEHEIHAPCSGKITEFLVENGQPVEYHQPLIRITSIEDIN